MKLVRAISLTTLMREKLIGHLIKGVELLDRFCSKISNFPSNTRMHLKHILISHHGMVEHGSPKTPLTSEANLVHFIDLMDSQTALGSR